MRYRFPHVGVRNTIPGQNDAIAMTKSLREFTYFICMMNVEQRAKRPSSLRDSDQVNRTWAVMIPPVYIIMDARSA